MNRIGSVYPRLIFYFQCTIAPNELRDNAQVSGPSVGLLITRILGAALSFIGLIASLFETGIESIKSHEFIGGYARIARYGKFLNLGLVVLAILFGVNWITTLISL